MNSSHPTFVSFTVWVVGLSVARDPPSPLPDRSQEHSMQVRMRYAAYQRPGSGAKATTRRRYRWRQEKGRSKKGSGLLYSSDPSQVELRHHKNSDNMPPYVKESSRRPPHHQPETPGTPSID